MTTWHSLAQYEGYYDSEEISINLSGTGSISNVKWIAFTPTGSSITVYTSYSLNGFDWSLWEMCVNNGEIPGISPTLEETNIKIKYRIFMTTNALSSIPLFQSLEFSFEPILMFDNKGDVNCSPEVWITKIGGGTFSLINTSKGNEEFKFVNLADGEIVYINSEREHIETSLVNTYRYSNFNDNYLRLPIGKNIFRFNGHAKLQFRFQYKVVQ